MEDGSSINFNNSNFNDSNSCHGDFGEVSFHDNMSQLILNENFVIRKLKNINFYCLPWSEECNISEKNGWYIKVY